MPKNEVNSWPGKSYDMDDKRKSQHHTQLIIVGNTENAIDVVKVI